MKTLLFSLAAVGLAAIPLHAKEKPAILLVLTNHGQLGETGKPTGFYLSEAAHPWEVFRQADFQVVLATPNGGPAPVDPKSHPSDDTVSNAFWEAYGDTGGKAVPKTLSLKEVNPKDYAAVFFAGGHGTMWDFAVSPDVTRIVEQIDRQGGVVAAVCHGPVALVNARQPSGEPLVKGRKVTVFTNAEEEAVELTSVVPFLPESRLRELGAEMIPGESFKENAVRDGRLVTGQNPASATRAAELVVEALSEKQPRK